MRFIPLLVYTTNRAPIPTRFPARLARREVHRRVEGFPRIDERAVEVEEQATQRTVAIRGGLIVTHARLRLGGLAAAQALDEAGEV